MKLQRPTTNPLLPLYAGLLIVGGLFFGFTETDYRPAGAYLTCGSAFLTTDSDDYYANGPLVEEDASVGVIMSATADANRYAQLCDIHLRGKTYTAWTLTVVGLIMLALVLLSAWPGDPSKRRDPAETR